MEFESKFIDIETHLESLMNFVTIPLIYNPVTMHHIFFKKKKEIATIILTALYSFSRETCRNISGDEY